MQDMNMMHCLQPSVFERQVAYLQSQQQQEEEETNNNFSIDSFLSFHGEGLGDGWPILTSNADNPIDIRDDGEEELGTTTTPTSTLSNSTLTTQVGKEKSSKKRKAGKSPVRASDDEEKRKKVEQRSEGKKKQKINKREETENSSKKEIVEKPDYIHVRARRGQATDSHSLAERVRRERISERMKYLQGLVPGCNKITGKAGMLDEIINYVQSLQGQVEFLSMKLASVHPSLDFNMDASYNKEMISMPLQLHPALLQHNNALQLAEPSLLDSSFNILRTTSGWENHFGVEFHQGRGAAFPFQQLQGNLLLNNMKMEM